MMQFWQTHKWWLICTFLISGVSTILLVGLPGAALTIGFDKTINLLCGRSLNDPIDYGESSWPIAVVYSIVFPFFVFGLYLAIRALPIQWNRFSLVAALTITALGLALAFHALCVYPVGYKRSSSQLQHDLSPQGRISPIRGAVNRLKGSDKEFYLVNIANGSPANDISSEFVEAWEKLKPQLDELNFMADEKKIFEKLEVQIILIQAREDLITLENTRSAPEWIELRKIATQAEDCLAKKMEAFDKQYGAWSYGMGGYYKESKDH